MLLLYVEHYFFVSDDRSPPEAVVAVPLPSPTPPTYVIERKGLDSGQKAGIAIGVIIAITFVAGLVFIIVSRMGVSAPSLPSIDALRERVNNIVSRPTAKHERFDTPGMDIDHQGSSADDKAGGSSETPKDSSEKTQDKAETKEKSSEKTDVSSKKPEESSDKAKGSTDKSESTGAYETIIVS